MIRIEKIVEFLNQYDPKVYMKTAESSILKDVVLLSGLETEYKDNLLYICDASKLCFFQNTPPAVNILCVANKPIQDEDVNNMIHNVIILHGVMDIQELLQSVGEFFDSCWRLASSEYKLAETLVSGRGLQYIVDTASEIFGNPLLILDTNYKLLAYSRNIKSDDFSWQKITDDGYCTSEMIESMMDGKFLEIYSSGIPIYEERRDPFPYNFQNAGIRIGGKVVGHASLIEFKRSFTKNDAELMIFLCDVLACEMQKDRFISNTKGVMYENFIADLFDGKIKTRNVIEERIKYLDFLKQENFYVITARIRPDCTINRTLPYLRDLLETIMSDSKTIIYNNDIVMLISRGKESYMPKLIFEQISEFIKKNQMLGGVSNCFQNIEDARMHYLQSSKAINLGFRLNREESIYFYEDFVIYHLIEAAENQEGLKTFLNPLLIKLVNYDLKYQTDFMDSLYAYLSSGNNLTKAAQVFDIHRNSMYYRIKKIGEILDVNIDDPNMTFSLLLSFKLLMFSTYMNGTNFAEALKKLN